MDSWLPFGVLRRPHGMNGEILLAPFNAASAELGKQILPVRVRLVDGLGSSESELVSRRSVHDGFLVRFRDHDGRESVASLVGREVQLPRQALAPLAAGEFYVEDVVGCDVFGVEGQHLGRISGVFWNGAQDVMRIVAADGSERLLPLVPQFIRSFEPAHRRVIVEFHEP